MLTLGSDWLVDSSVDISQVLGVNELVIGLTIVVVGTSLPEVATSVVAALKKESDIAGGNAVGSNIFNLLGVKIFSARRVGLEGRNLFPWPVTIKYKGLTVVRAHDKTVVTFLNGESVTVTDTAPCIVEM